MHGFKPYIVVIRFQICIFDILNTAISAGIVPNCKL